MVLVIFLYFVSLFYNFQIYCQSKEHDCDVYLTCDECVSSYYLCYWCAEEDFTDVRCGTEKQLDERNCKDIYKLSNDHRSEGIINTEHFTIQPTNIFASMLKGSTVEIDIEVTKNQDLYSEIVFVIDYSATMSGAIIKIKELVKTFVEKKDEYMVKRFGIVKFIDKGAYPFIQEKNGQPIHPPLYIEVISSLTDDQQKLEDDLNRQSVGGNVDYTEASFDAIVECALCHEKIGWSSDKSVLKIIYLFTDATSKSEGEGRSIGAIKPHDLKCHIGADGKVANEGVDFDYVSLGSVGYVLRTNNMQIVMVVPKILRPYYTAVGKSWRGVRWLVVELDQQNLDLGKIMKDSYKDINSNVNIFFEPNKYIEIQTDVKCPLGSVKRNYDECTDVSNGKTVTFTIFARLIDGKSLKSMKFVISTMETIEFHIQQISKCECPEVTDREKCNNKGKMVCGKCLCDPGYTGYNCQCESGKVNPLKSCQDPKSGLICSSRGICDECGKCICQSSVRGYYNKNEYSRYSGQYCECSQAMCYKSHNNICGGIDKGDCVCDRCVCKPKYTGVMCDMLNCENPEVNNLCKKDETSKECSGNGQCDCGVCKCNFNSIGDYCENTLSLTCNNFDSVVLCAIQNKNSNPGATCDTSKYKIDFTKVEKYNCLIYDSKGCKIYFNFVKTQEDAEYLIQIKEINKEEDCPKPINIILITSIVFALLLVIGIIIVGLYVGITIFYYKQEAKRFMREIASSSNADENNPLYQALPL